MPTSANARKYRTRRKAALNKLLRAQGGDPYARCHWCGREIVWFQIVGADSILTEYNRLGPPPPEIEYIYRGERCAHAWASVDHVVPLSAGGTNDPDNLVPSCLRCNWARSEEHQRPDANN